MKMEPMLYGLSRGGEALRDGPEKAGLLRATDMNGEVLQKGVSENSFNLGKARITVRPEEPPSSAASRRANV